MAFEIIVLILILMFKCIVANIEIIISMNAWQYPLSTKHFIFTA